jgi:hypothetical protein
MPKDQAGRGLSVFFEPLGERGGGKEEKGILEEKGEKEY